MSYTYFFGRDKICYNNHEILANDGIEVDSTTDKNVTVTAKLVTTLMDELCTFFNMDPYEVVSISLDKYIIINSYLFTARTIS